MNFYLCTVAGSRQLAGTQAEAKALDKAFKPHDVPTDKPGLMAYINRLFSQADKRNVTAEEILVLHPMVTVPDAATLAFDDLTPSAFVPHREIIRHRVVTEAAVTGADMLPPGVKARGNKIMEPIFTRINCEQAVETMAYEDIRKLEEIINERKKELLAEERAAAKVKPVAPPAPRARSRPA